MGVITGYLAALAVGGLLALIGGGGAILTLPILVYAFRLSAWEATTYSLFIVGGTAALGALKHARAGNIDYRTAIRFAAPAIAAVHLVRHLVVPTLPASIELPFGGVVTKDSLVMVVLATAMLGSAFGMLRRTRGTGGDEGGTPPDGVMTGKTLAASIARGFGVGLFTGLVGAGGGFLLVPAMTLAERLPVKRAVATSLLVIAVNSLFGFLGDYAAGREFDWSLLLTFTAVAGCGMLGGTALTRVVSERHVRALFGATLIVMALVILSLEIRPWA